MAVLCLFVVIGLGMFLIPVVPGPLVYLSSGVLLVPVIEAAFGDLTVFNSLVRTLFAGEFFERHATASLFHSLDTDGDGIVTKNEFRSGMTKRRLLASDATSISHTRVLPHSRSSSSNGMVE